jgi:hypothetical protein
MLKILMGLLAAVAIAIGGFFGFQFYMQHRVAGEIDAAFDQIRAGGGKASHGKVSFDLLGRTVDIADIVSESGAQGAVSVKIARVTASGVSQPDAARFAADSFEATDIEIAAGLAAQPGLSITYKIPRLIAKDYSGPVGLPRPLASSSVIDLYRFTLEYAASITASSISAPRMAGTITFGAAAPGGVEFAYSGLALQGVKGGKIATAKLDEMAFTVGIQVPGMADKITGNLANVATYDIDINAIAAVLDPQNANDDQYYRSYRQVTTGAYTISSAQGRTRIDGLAIDDVALRPSRMQLPALMAMIPAAGTAPPTPAQARDLLDKVAQLYEGIRIGNVEMRGMSIETPPGPVKLATMRFNMENGKIGELAFEGFETRLPTGSVTLGRFALKSLDIANFMRVAAQISTGRQPPPPDAALAMIPLIEGIEVKALVAPYKNTDKLINIDTISLDWGQFVGPIPSKIRLTARMTGPIDGSDAALQPLIAAGMDKLAIDSDLGATWTEASRAFVIEPVSLELGSLLKATARVAFANVPRGVFSINPVQAVNMAAQIEAGAIELTLRDLGGIDLAVAQYARMQSVSREAARQAIVDSIRTSSEETAKANPDAASAVEALTRFIETPRQTLVIKLTPLGKAPVMQLVQLLKTDPLIALAQFRIEASTGL